MAVNISRRVFLNGIPTVGLASGLAGLPGFAGQGAGYARAAAAPSAVHDRFPSQDPELVREMVSVAHFDLDRVRALVGQWPTLANAAWDWGFGDWESALGAASHMGNRAIAELLIARGARPMIFSAAMLGQIDVVRAFVTASPGAQRIRGPHGITLLAHAEAGGAQAAGVLQYLKALGDADPRYRSEPIAEAERSSLVGVYEFGPGPADRLEVAVDERGGLTLKRSGSTERSLFHLGSRTFHPAGAEQVRIRFDMEGGRATVLKLQDGDRLLKAARSSG